MKRRITKKTALLTTAAAFAVAGGALFATPLAASAHVHVDPDTASAGAYAVLTFRVPNESDTATTSSLTVDLPTDTPVTFAATEPVPGWTAKVITSTLPAPVTEGDVTITEAPTQIVWTADDGVGIKTAQFQRFPVQLGPLPDVDSITLPAHQGYSDGTVVDWNEPTPASGQEPEHPAPVVYIDAAPPAEEGSMSVTMTSGGDSGSADSSASASADSSADLGLGFGIGGLALGAVALAIALVALLRRPRTGGASE
ncbi:YcnI family protein [Cnuibacter sp. UC19_7]|uniref:YcnI family copper-binding membrane protein n=1 Tax=Cnuibacter sp. UC19_7 TaxID=3350166 RepID=UPI00366FD30D